MKIIFRCGPDLEEFLSKPFHADHGLPDWLKRMPMSAISEELDSDMRTVNHCSPFIDAMSSGFLVPLPCDIHVADSRLEWDWQETPIQGSRSPMAFHVNAPVVGSRFYADGRLLIKFKNFWTIELEPGYSLLVTDPINHADLPLCTVTGLEDADTYKANYIHFPALWIGLEFSGVLAKGTPVAQCIPVWRERLDFEFVPLSGEAARRFAATQASA